MEHQYERNAGFDPIAYINEPHWQESRLGLDRIEALLEGLGRPHDRFKAIHVAGTNGKGSTCSFLASIMQAAGYRTGLFTSPFVHEFSDRIRLDGVNIAPDDLCDVTLEVKAVADRMDDHPTEFELMTAVAFTYFARMGCDIAVVEVGMGGRLDSTNVIGSPEACVITPIGFDHVDMLGDTLAKIAGEKAGIIKRGSPVVSWVQEPEAMEVVERIAAEQGAELTVPDISTLAVHGVIERSDPQGGAMLARVFDYGGIARRQIGLLGRYQPENAALAIEVAHVLAKRGWDIPESAVAQGLLTAKWPGRFEVAAADPPFIIDGGHNPAGVRALASSLADVFPGRKAVFIMGVLEDKDYPAMIGEAFPAAAAFVTVAPPNPRALSAQALAEEVERIARNQGASIAIKAASGFEDAVALARTMAVGDEVICAFGSLFSVASVEAALKGR